MKISISGVRGIFGKDLTLDTIITFSKRFASFLISRGIRECVIARDTRVSSRVINDVVTSTLLTYGIDVYNLGVAPTPFLFREARRYRGGLMITSSHNPLEWNGLKFVIDGRGIFEDELSIILSIDEPTHERIGKESSIVSSYPDEIPFHIHADKIVAIDTAGGSAKDYAKILLERIGCRVYAIDYDNPSHPDPTTNLLSDLSEMVLSNNCSIGFAYDLDGDRLVVMDREGNRLKADTTLLLAIAKFSSMNIKKFVVSIDTSNSIRDLLSRRGSSLIYSKVGEANVIRTMLENGIDVGGEGSSGGVIYKPFNMCRDGLLASMIIASMIDSEDYKECIELSRYTTIRTKFDVRSELHDKVMSMIESRLEHESYEVSRLDGIKGYIDEDTWVLVRRSNTEDIIRLSIESDDASKANRLLKYYEGMIKGLI